MFEFLLHFKRYLPNKIKQEQNERQDLINRAQTVLKKKSKLLDDLDEDTRRQLRETAMKKVFKINPKI